MPDVPGEVQRLVSVLAFAVLLILPGTASAGTVRHQTFCPEGKGDCSREVTFVAGPGEANALELRLEDGEVLLQDHGADLVAEGGCRAVTPRAARCRSGHVTLKLGDGNDLAQNLSTSATFDAVLGEDGNDRTMGFKTSTGGAGDDSLAGTGGSDALAGGPGRDRLSGGAGDDILGGDALDAHFNFGVATLEAGETGADHLDGGAGQDAAAYLRRTAVRIDLSEPGPDGGPGEGDELVGIEGALTGSGADHLIGDAGHNVFASGRGDDVVRGAGGNDDLRGEDGVDTLSGGPGDDRLAATDRPDQALEPVDCGGGRDRVSGSGDLLTRCERLTLADPNSVTLAPVPADRDRRLLRFRLPCERLVSKRNQRGPCRLVLRAAQGTGWRKVIRRRIRPGGALVNVRIPDPSATLRLSVIYLDSYDRAGRVSWAIPGVTDDL